MSWNCQAIWGLLLAFSFSFQYRHRRRQVQSTHFDIESHPTPHPRPLTPPNTFTTPYSVCCVNFITIFLNFHMSLIVVIYLRLKKLTHGGAYLTYSLGINSLFFKDFHMGVFSIIIPKKKKKVPQINIISMQIIKTYFLVQNHDFGSREFKIRSCKKIIIKKKNFTCSPP